MYILYSLLHLNFSWMNCFLLSEFVRKVLLGLTAGTLACCVNIPFDVAKSRSAPRGISGIKLLQFQIPICISLFSMDYMYRDKILKIRDIKSSIFGQEGMTLKVKSKKIFSFSSFFKIEPTYILYSILYRPLINGQQWFCKQFCLHGDICKIKDCIIYTVQCTLDLDNMLANKQRGIGLYNTAGSGQRKCTKTPRYIRNTAQSKTLRYM